MPESEGRGETGLPGKLAKNMKDLNLVVAHLGGGITIGAHHNGKVVDCTHG